MALQQGLGLDASDISNHSDYSTSGVNLSGGISVASSKPAEKPSGTGGTDSAGGGTVNNGTNWSWQNIGKTGVNGAAAGFSSDSGSASSTTHSGISQGALTVTGEAGQQQKTGQTAKEAANSIQRDILTGADSGALGKNWEGQTLLQEQAANAQIMATFGQQATKAGAQYAQDQLNKANGLREIAKLETDPAKQAAMLAEAAQLESDWKDGGTNRVLMHVGIGLLSGGAAGAAGAAGSALATPQLVDMLRDTTLPQPVRDALLLTAGAAIGAAIGGVEGAAAGTNEMANNGLGTVAKRLGLAGLAMCLKNPGCLALTGATGLELSRLANLAMEKNPRISEDGAYAIAVADYLGDQARGHPATPPPVPSHTGNDKPVNPTPGGSSTAYPADGPKESGTAGGKPLDSQKPGEGIISTPITDPLSIITLAVPPRDKESIDSSLSGVMGGAPVLDDVKGKNYISHYPGGTKEDAEKIFDGMPLRDVISINSDYGNWGRRGTLLDGAMVIVRPSKDGRPTIEIQDTNRPGGTRRVQEIRFGGNNHEFSGSE